MPTTVQVPALGESITEAIVARWLKQVGDSVAVDEPVVELETDKITVEVPAPSAGVVSKHLAGEEDTVNVGDAIFEIEASDTADAGEEARADAEAHAEASEGEDDGESQSESDSKSDSKSDSEAPAAMPAARAEAARTGVDLDAVKGTGRGGRILKEDVQRAADQPKSQTQSQSTSVGEAKPKSTQSSSGRSPGAEPGGSSSVAANAATKTVRMSPLRKRIAERLVEAQQTAAILTTFNEVDMSAVMAIRKTFKQAFIDAHEVKLGFMSFFVKAAVSALRNFPAVNAEIDGDEIVYKNFYNIGVAVGGGKGLVVPVIRDADGMSFAGIEKEIGRLADLAKRNKLALSDLTGGSFTISNGGIYGSMLSTPILNPPQTGILGLHNIVERPVAIDGKVEIRPIMYLALSYDHRLVDGREAVQFLVHVKQAIEDPRRLMFDL